ncbi:MAG: B12-binding domain-containing radical SAM protein [Nitrospinota bacterium]|nr:B12-binding domain-containing radical SAM protein [Nitrospinota bacterium]MDH5755184.1 B12-binding domain-containing radical SAM protein [Nitrospinota bacterium]
MNSMVLLCVPPQGYFAERWQDSSMPSLGVLYMAACLKREGIPVRTLPAFVLKLNIADIVRQVEEERPSIFGVTVTTENRLEAFDLARAVKRAVPETHVVLGGPHCMATGLDTLTHVPEVDVVVSGEGEETIVELFRAVEAGGGSGELSKVRGIWYREGGKVVSTGPRVKIPDLNTLPMPARELEDMALYNFHVDVPGRGKLPAANLMTSRGCPFDCNFCATPVNWGRKVRGVTAEKVLDEIEHVMDRYGVQAIWFYDDTLNYNPKRLEKICDMMIERKLGLSWFCEIRVDAIDRRLFDKMAEAGLFHVGFGVESANERVCREIIHKKATLTQALDVIDWCNDTGVIANPFFIFSHPTETWEEALETIRFAESLKGRAMCSMAILHVYPATELWDRALGEGKIPADFTWTAKDDPRIMELPEAQGRVPLYMDKLTWFQLSTIIFRFSQSALKVSLWSKVKKAAARIDSFGKFAQYFVMGLALVNLKLKKALGGGA